VSTRLITTVVFDVGGTLLRTARPVGETYAHFATHYGATFCSDRAQAGFKRAWRTLRPRPPGTIPNDGDDRAWWKHVVRAALEDQPGVESFPFDDYFEEVYAFYERPEAWRVFPEVVPVLEKLKAANYRLAVLSNWDRRLRLMLNALDLAPWFQDVFISAELGWEKPEPAIYRHVETTLGARPDELLIAGDDPLNDYQAPRSQGWNSLWIERKKTDLTEVLVELGLDAAR
jgi:REG-2-like HAD superfamily hydrolase